MDLILFVIVVLALALLAGLVSLISWLTKKPTNQEIENLAQELIIKSGMELVIEGEPEKEKAKPTRNKEWIHFTVFGRDSKNRKTRRQIRRGKR
jgi:hypothetical protein